MTSNRMSNSYLVPSTTSIIMNIILRSRFGKRLMTLEGYLDEIFEVRGAARVALNGSKSFITWATEMKKRQ